MSDYLVHYGVQGMKWGIRKQPESKSTSYKNLKPGTKLTKEQSRYFTRRKRKIIIKTFLAATLASAAVAALHERAIEQGKKTAEDFMKQYGSEPIQ